MIEARLISSKLDNKYALDEIIDNAEKGIESYVRIYFDDSQEIHIRDVQYKNGIFIITSGSPGNSNIGTGTYKYIVKEYWKILLIAMV